MKMNNVRKLDISRLIRTFVYFVVMVNSASLVNAEPTFGTQSSTQNTRWNFDFVEQFDSLKDWRSPQSGFGELAKKTKLPKLSDGSDSAWNFYASSMDSEHSELWIGAFGDKRVWRGTKSAAIDIGGAKGPSQLGLYLGDGYTDAHVFFMVNIPKNEFPTSCAGGNCQNGALGSYIQEQAYTWFSSWPLLSFQAGCTSPECKNPTSSQQTIHIKQYDYGLTPGLMLALQDSNQASELWALDGNTNLDNRLGNWFGLEFHITQTDTETRYTIWVYDQKGKAVTLLDNKAFIKPFAMKGKPMNRITFGGDKSDTYAWGPTMKSEYFIDDVIIDDKRIGPTYFSILHVIKASTAAKFDTDTKASVAPRAPSGFKLRVVSPSP